MQLGTTIKRFRLANGLSQAELASRAGVSASFLSLLERDKREPTLTVLRRLAEHLGLPFGVFVAAALTDVSEDPRWRDIMNKIIEAVRLQILTQVVEQESLFPPDSAASPSND